MEGHLWLYGVLELLLWGNYRSTSPDMSHHKNDKLWWRSKDGILGDYKYVPLFSKCTLGLSPWGNVVAVLLCAGRKWECSFLFWQNLESGGILPGEDVDLTIQSSISLCLDWFSQGGMYVAVEAPWLILQPNVLVCHVSRRSYWRTLDLGKTGVGLISSLPLASYVI